MTMHEAPTILIVDDSQQARLDLTKFFRRSFINATIHSVETYDLAKKKIEQGKFDIISLDGDLPDFKRGYSLIPLIRQCQNPDCKIIMISGQSNHVAEGIILGADLGFTKYQIEVHDNKAFKLSENFELVSTKQTVSV